jgi:hypothetical protein
VIFRSKKNKVSFLLLWHNQGAQAGTRLKDKTITGGGGGRRGEIEWNGRNVLPVVQVKE